MADRDTFAFNAERAQRHSKKWQEESKNLADAGSLLSRSRFRSLSEPGIFAELMPQHEALVAKMTARYSEGAAVWSTIGEFLLIANDKFQAEEQQAVQRLRKLQDAITANPQHPAGNSPGMKR
ncbi:hypothetical protein GCM10022225_16080 [Plantactinospora mayteni]|uniref:Uncharacterized protein n=1 Tax=Plantactinospora mayteni TaxID=566021 RepID=A0ABQ4EG48_9ACTN|nr:hypothetical protein [Plantactinospora mayteni]GIG93682.1 hypothetical protein Pma05_02550 [Plantactinospora mayteni]